MGTWLASRWNLSKARVEDKLFKLQFFMSRNSKLTINEINMQKQFAIDQFSISPKGIILFSL